MCVRGEDLSDGAHVRCSSSLVLHHAVGLLRVQEASSRTVAGTRRQEIQVVAEEGGHLEEIELNEEEHSAACQRCVCVCVSVSVRGVCVCVSVSVRGVCVKCLCVCL